MFESASSLKGIFVRFFVFLGYITLASYVWGNDETALYINKKGTDPDIEKAAAVFVLKGDSESIGKISQYQLNYVPGTFSDSVSINGTEVGIDDFKQFTKQFQVKVVDRRDLAGEPPEPPSDFTERRFRNYFNSFNIFVDDKNKPLMKWEENGWLPVYTRVEAEYDLIRQLEKWAGFSVIFTSDIPWDTDSVQVDREKRIIWVDTADPIAEVLEEFNKTLLTSDPVADHHLLWVGDPNGGRNFYFFNHIFATASQQNSIILYKLWRNQYIKDMASLVSTAADAYINSLEFIPIVGQGLEVVQVIAAAADGNILTAAFQAAPGMFNCAKAVKKIEFDLIPGLNFSVQNNASFKNLKNTMARLQGTSRRAKWTLLGEMCATIHKSDSANLPRVMYKIFCFPQGTGVITDSGLVDISEIRAGHRVLAYDEITGKNDWVPVAPPVSFKADTLVGINYRLEGDVDERLLRCTPGHYMGVLHNEEVIWKKAEDLLPGAMFATQDGRKAIVESIARILPGEEVYSLHVPGFATYYVEDGILTHNASCYSSMKILFTGKISGDALEFAEELYKYCGKSADDMDVAFKDALAAYTNVTQDQIDGSFVRRFLIDDVDGVVNPFKQDLASAIRSKKKNMHEWCPVNNIDTIFRKSSNATQFRQALDFMHNVRINTKKLVFSNVKKFENGRIIPGTPGKPIYGHIGSGADLSASHAFHTELDNIFRASFREGGSFDKSGWYREMDKMMHKWFNTADARKYLKEIRVNGNF